MFWILYKLQRSAAVAEQKTRSWVSRFLAWFGFHDG